MYLSPNGSHVRLATQPCSVAEVRTERQNWVPGFGAGSSAGPAFHSLVCFNSPAAEILKCSWRMHSARSPELVLGEGTRSILLHNGAPAVKGYCTLCLRK